MACQTSELSIKPNSFSWDSDKEPNGFLPFILNFGSMVRTLTHGSVLEDFLDEMLAAFANSLSPLNAVAAGISMRPSSPLEVPPTGRVCQV